MAPGHPPQPEAITVTARLPATWSEEVAVVTALGAVAGRYCEQTSPARARLPLRDPPRVANP